MLRMRKRKVLRKRLLLNRRKIDQMEITELTSDSSGGRFFCVYTWVRFMVLY